MGPSPQSNNPKASTGSATPSSLHVSLSPHPGATNTPRDPAASPLNVSISPDVETGPRKGESRESIPQCFLEKDIRKINFLEWYSLSNVRADGSRYTPEGSLEKMCRDETVWGNDFRSMLKWTATVGAATLTGSICLLAYNSLLPPIAGAAVAAATFIGAAVNWRVQYLRNLAIEERYTQRIDRPREDALGAENFLECLAHTAIAAHNTVWMNPIPSLYRPNRLKFDSNADINDVSYLVRLYQNAAKYAFENRIGMRKMDDGREQAIEALKNNLFDQKLNPGKEGFVNQKERWLEFPQSLVFLSGGCIGSLGLIVGGIRLFEAGRQFGLF